jgi:hypothetical protein
MINFDTVISFLFDKQEDRQWYFDDSHVDLSISMIEIIDISKQVFERIDEISNTFSEKQICMGLQYIINTSFSSWGYAFVSESVPVNSRVAAIQAMFTVFDRLFASKCTQDMRYTEITGQRNLTFAEMCYMWWDIFPRHGVPQESALISIDSAIVETITRVLHINNFACVESALHGLSHWFSAVPEVVIQKIDEALITIPPDLRKYALDARSGTLR